MKVQHVPIEWVNRTWPMVKPFFEAVTQHSRDGYTPEHVETMVSTGQWLLVVFSEDGAPVGAMTLVFYNRPTARVAFITAFGGKGVSTPEALQQLKAIAAERGATALEGAVRESVAKLYAKLGFIEKSRNIGIAV